MRKSTLLAALLVSVIGTSVFAQTSTPRIDKRAANQQKRIDEGVKSGQLTAKEAERLQKREDKLNANIQEAKADGTVTNAERRQLTRQEHRNSRVIRGAKHNNKTAN